MGFLRLCLSPSVVEEDTCESNAPVEPTGYVGTINRKFLRKFCLVCSLPRAPPGRHWQLLACSPCRVRWTPGLLCGARKALTYLVLVRQSRVNRQRRQGSQFSSKV